MGGLILILAVMVGCVLETLIHVNQNDQNITLVPYEIRESCSVEVRRVSHVITNC